MAHMLEQEQRTEKDAPLRRDIRMLGNALGRAIQQHDGLTVFATVEQLRRNCKRLRECEETLAHAAGTPAATRKLRDEIDALDREITQVVDGCDLDTAIDVIRAFTVYFHLVNTAEQHHRTRRRFVYEVNNMSSTQPGSLAALVALEKFNECSKRTALRRRHVIHLVHKAAARAVMLLGRVDEVQINCEGPYNVNRGIQVAPIDDLCDLPVQRVDFVP